jgi:hypothetical protein
MRRMLILLVIVAACAVSFAALWIFRGPEISSFIDRYRTVEIQSVPIHSIAYEGNGSGGILIVNDITLSLNEVSPGLSLSVGSTKDNQLALASSDKVFPFGPLTSDAENTGDRLATVRPAGDEAFLVIRHSVLSWPTQIDFNFMTGQSPSWKRHVYQQIRWKKSSGANLELLWRYEQFFYPGNGWASGFMTREGSTGLIRIDIKE